MPPVLICRGVEFRTFITGDDSNESGNGLLPDQDEIEESVFRSIIQAFDYGAARGAYEGDRETIQDAESRLIKHFSTTFRIYLWSVYLPVMLAALVIGAGVDWYIQPVPLESYGIVSVLIGVFTLAGNTSNGRYLIAIQTTSDGPKHRELLARRTARTIAGGTAFLFGFAIQLFATAWVFGWAFLAALLAYSTSQIVKDSMKNAGEIKQSD